MRKLFLFAPVLLLAACGDSRGGVGPSDTPTPPTTPSSVQAEYAFVDGLSGVQVPTPVVAGPVDVGGTAASDANANSIFVNGMSGTQIGFDAPGYLQREVALAPGGHTVHLWPTRLDLITREVIYTQGGNQSGEMSLRRPTASEVVFVVTSAEALSTVQYGVDRLNEAFGAWIRVRISPVADGAVNVNINIDTRPGFGAETGVFENNGRITGGEISIGVDFLGTHVGETLMVHEGGHALGLQHLWTVDGIMSTVDPYPFSGFTQEEKEVIHLMGLRDPRNRYPDNGYPAGSAASISGLQTVCTLKPPDPH